ncbi:MAG: thermonuclease family protein, partial [Geminicoccaceae bacterium]
MNHLFPAYLLILTLAGASPALAGSAVGRVSVVDADTLELHGERIRLAAIDAPEARQTCRPDGKVWPRGRRAAFAQADVQG